MQVNHNNWALPIQICSLLQVHLNIPVQHILWGHPNLRDPKGKGAQWAKEHRIRIYAEDFLPVGFHFQFKQRILEVMAEWNKRQGTIGGRKCNPLAQHRLKKKPRHRDEKSGSLPAPLRGRHFDAYFEICTAIGCKQGEPSEQLIHISER